VQWQNCQKKKGRYFFYDRNSTAIDSIEFIESYLGQSNEPAAKRGGWP
jgi:hypothetical protein